MENIGRNVNWIKEVFERVSLIFFTTSSLPLLLLLLLLQIHTSSVDDATNSIRLYFPYSLSNSKVERSAKLDNNGRRRDPSSQVLLGNRDDYYLGSNA